MVVVTDIICGGVEFGVLVILVVVRVTTAAVVNMDVLSGADVVESDVISTTITTPASASFNPLSL